MRQSLRAMLMSAPLPQTPGTTDWIPESGVRFVGVACRTLVLPALRLCVRERFGNGIRHGRPDPGRVEGWGRRSFQRLRSRSSSGQADKVVVCMLENSCNAATTWSIHGPLTVAPEI